MFEIDEKFPYRPWNHKDNTKMAISCYFKHKKYSVAKWLVLPEDVEGDPWEYAHLVCDEHVYSAASLYSSCARVMRKAAWMRKNEL